jgi:hypothetical protein
MHIYIKYYNKFNCFLMWRYNDVSFATFPNSRYTFYRWYALLEMVFSSLVDLFYECESFMSTSYCAMNVDQSCQRHIVLWMWINHVNVTLFYECGSIMPPSHCSMNVDQSCNDLQTTDDIAKRTRRFSVMERRNKKQIYHNCDISFLT